MRTSLTYLLSTIQKVGQSCLRTHSQHGWIRYSLLGLVLLIWLTTSNAKLFQTSDTEGWISGSKGFKDCILLVNLDACQSISYWPIWNNFLAVLFSWFTNNQIKLWYYLNIISFVAYLLVIIYLIRDIDFKWRFLVIFSVILSPLLFQVHSTFTEIQQGLFLTLAFLSLAKRRIILSTIFIVLSITTKETFILLWVIILIFQIIKEMISILKKVSIEVSLYRFRQILLYSFRNLFRDIIKKLLIDDKIRSLTIGILIGSIMIFGFNYLRYHQLTNISYYSLNTRFSMEFNYAILNVIWSLVSPNGGIIFSYGLFISIILLYLVLYKSVKISGISNSSNQNISYIDESISNDDVTLIESIIFIVIILICGLFTTSLWWATFGWDTWGHRLIIPYIMPVIMLVIVAIQEYSENELARVALSNIKLLDINQKLSKIFKISIKKLVIISIPLFVACGLIYNMVTIQAIYRKDIDVVVESLHSQPWCREMVSDSRGIMPYYWLCALERFRYIPILHRPPRILGPEGKILISMACMSVLVNLPFMRPWPQRNRLVEPQPKIDQD